MNAERDPRIAEPDRVDPVDPLRLCVFATVALLGWFLGPVALLVFAGTGYLSYARARRAGLVSSRCRLRDTRWVLAYLALLVAVSAVALVLAARGGPRIGWW